MQVCVPTGTVSGVVDVPFNILTHTNVGTTLQVKWQDDTGDKARTIIIKINKVLQEDEVYSGVFHIDTTKEVNGLRNWRFYDFHQHLNGNGQRSRPRWCVNVNNPGRGAPKSGCSLSGTGPTVWYLDGSFNYGYARCSAAIKNNGDGTYTATPSYGVNGGPAIIGSSGHLNPSFHHPGDYFGADGGTVLWSTPTAVRKAAITFAAQPGDKLAIRGIQKPTGHAQHDCVGTFVLQ
jgi:hypothetical protein